MAQLIWTQNKRRALFEVLVERFGRYSTWEKAQMPGKGMDAEYEEFCTLFAAAIGAKSWKAVVTQIRFATAGVAEWTRTNGNDTAILAMAAAYEAGFIGRSSMPASFDEGN